MNVRRFIEVAPLIVAVIPVGALAKDCDTVKAEIDAKIKAKGAAGYSLEIVDTAAVKDGKIVGNCGVGTKSIVYLKGALNKTFVEPRFDSAKQAEPLLTPSATTAGKAPSP